MRGLFVEPFYGGSHKAFLDGLVRHSAHDLAVLSLPDAEWRRRMRRGAQELAPAARALAGDFDFLVASDMLDLPVFLALTRPRFGATPVMLYMHENQFTYPRLRGTKFNSWFGQVNYLSACAADVVAFNSEFHRDDFVGALRTLASQPNNWLLPDAIDAIAQKSIVLPIGVELSWLDDLACEPPGGPPIVLWNHRWEFDKAPDVFARAIQQLLDAGVSFRLALAGEPGPNPAPELLALRDLPADRLFHVGYAADTDDYARLLWQSDIVASTSRHEFFGVGMVEAMYCGCIPLAPARFNYPALVPSPHHDTCLFHTSDEFVEKLATLLRERPSATQFRASARRFAWEAVAPAWDHALAALGSHDSATVRITRNPSR